MSRLLAAALLALTLAAPTTGAAQQPDTAMTRLVLPRNYPVRLLKKLGLWRLTLARDDRRASLQVDFALGPDSVTALANALAIDHVCYDCLAGTLDTDWHLLVRKPPTSSRLRLHTNDTTLSAIIGTTISIVGDGDLELTGRWQGDSAVGTWRQLPDGTAAHGTFVLRR